MSADYSNTIYIGAEFDIDDLFVEREEQIEEHCGKEVDQDNNYCPECGNSLAPDTVYESNEDLQRYEHISEEGEDLLYENLFYWKHDLPHDIGFYNLSSTVSRREGRTPFLGIRVRRDRVTSTVNQELTLDEIKDEKQKVEEFLEDLGLEKEVKLVSHSAISI